MFTALDADGNGTISFKEFENGLQKVGLAFLVDRNARHLFDKIDTNRGMQCVQMLATI
jgi:Ca2+-binding EF-hand superfamily protein